MTEHKYNQDCMSKNDHKCSNDHTCDHNHDQDSKEYDTIILTDDDGQDHEFLLLDTLDLEGSTYFVLMPIIDGDEESVTSEDEDNEDNDEAIILKLGKDDEGNEMLLDIEDDEEWEKVADAWENMDE